MPSLNNMKQVQSLIGMIHYIFKFSLRLSDLAEPIRELSKDKVLFYWGPELQVAFIQMKTEIATAPILSYYNPKNKLLYRQMPAPKVSVHVCYKM